jgi:CheY-like chemotaxis protein
VNSKTVLIADDDLAITQALSLRLKQLGLTTLRSPDASHALIGAQNIQPDLLILDVDMPGGNGLAVCEMLLSDPNCNKIPVIIHTGSSDQSLVNRCKQLSALYVLKTPGSIEHIVGLVSKILDGETDHTELASEKTAVRDESVTSPTPVTPTNVLQTAIDQATLPKPADLETVVPDCKLPVVRAVPVDNTPAVYTPAEKQPKVLCIDDDVDIPKVIGIKLERYGVKVISAPNGEQGYRTALMQKPDVIISDIVLPEGEGCYIINRLKSQASTAHIPVIILTGQSYPEIKQQLLTMGVAGYLTKPLDFDDFLRELRQHIDFADHPSQTPVGITA